jgi:hypothetical protein
VKVKPTAIASAVLALLVLEGCGTSAIEGPRSTTKVARVGGAVRVVPHPHLVGLVAVPWHRTQTLDHGRRLRIFYFGGASRCGGLRKVHVVDRTRSVVVTLFQGHDPGANYCPVTMAREKKVDVRLDHPLGQRRVVDGAE